MVSGRGVCVQSVVVLLVCVAGAAIYLHQPPRIVREKGPLTAFSAERAMKHIQAIAHQPHPAGSMAIDSVRETIMRDIRACGIKPDMQETVVNHVPGSAASVRNILARMPGTANTKAVALAAHYDSVMYGPGAADDSSGVAALLETMRALKAGPPLRNDVMFIFTDGEEGVQPGKGLRGAYGFVQHPWAKEIGVVLNFDARGVTGPSYMYRTSPENGWLIRQMIAADCHPIANSCMGTLSGLMPTNSDFSAFLEAGIPGLDFAFVGNIMRYHTSLDSPANLNPRSLQHHGEYALQLTRRFGDLPLDNPEASPVIFFNPLGAAMVAYPVAWALPLAVAALLALGALLGAGIKRGAFTAMDLLRGLATYLAYMLVTSLAALAVVGAGCMRRGYYLIYSSDVLMLALVCLAVWGFFLLIKRLRPAMMSALNAGALLVWAALLLATSIGFPGASYVFLWPLAFGTAGLALLVFGKSTDDGPPAWSEAQGRRASCSVCAALGLTAIPGVLIIAPVVYDIHTTLTVVFAPATIAILVLTLGLLVQPAYWLVAANRRLLPAAALTLGLALLLATVFWPGFSPEQPKLTSLSYALDTDTNQAYWLSCDAKSDEWTSAVIPKDVKPEPLAEFLSDDTQKVLKAPATVIDLTPASIEVLESTPIDNGRRLRIRVTSPRHAPRVVLFAEPGVRVRAATVNGRALLPVEGRWLLNYDILLPRGIDLTLDIEGNDPFQLTAVEHSPELPALEPNPLPPSPAYMIVKPNTPDLNHGWLKSNVTLVKKTFTL